MAFGVINGVWCNASGLPSASGITTAGAVVANNWASNGGVPEVLGSAGSRYIVLGWARITNGSNHVIGTDWIELRVLTGT